ncbi:MAG: bifunctional phosphoribosylaminoimidazolecarboxamide formyltransferase/IMP cyclohydrolase, partial [Phycisphaerae bacterium]
MSNPKIKRAIIAVYDKTGIADFARALVDEFGIEIISTGGTARHLKEAGIPVTMVEEVTGFPEMLDGRVKTIHPMIHAAILADRDNPEHMKTLEKHDIKPIDMVVVNLYPFEKTVADPNCTFEQAIEMIDIGGPCMLRAAAKNHKYVLVVDQPDRYESVLHALRNWDDESQRRDALQAGALAFLSTARYDIRVSTWLAAQQSGGQSPWRFFEGFSWGSLRYGENPHQKAELLQLHGSGDQADLTTADAVLDFEQEISFNNYADADAAFLLCQELTWAMKSTQSLHAALGGPYAVAFIKHMNACGCAIGDDPVDTYRRAYLGDPIAAAGGVLCMNFPVTRQIADMVMNSFGNWGKAAGAAFFKLDVWMAPGFDDDALALIRTPTEKRKWGTSCRFLCEMFTDSPPTEPVYDFKRISGGLLMQTRDLLGLNEDQWNVVTKRKPTESEMADLRFAWLVCKHTKSNAITICKDGMLLGNGAGQMSRVKSCDLAIQLARESGHGDKLQGAVAA